MHVLAMPTICMPITYHNEKEKLLNKQNTYHTTNIDFNSSFAICVLDTLSTSSMYLVGSLHIVPRKMINIKSIKKDMAIRKLKMENQIILHLPF
jgi:hypothetical protein